MSHQFKPFDQMTPEDYAAIGFKCGLEVHQQLKTGRKLFCRCPAARYSAEYDAEVLRHMRPTLSELGEYDGTALMEKKTRKNIYYRIHHDTVCTYEFDDTPPFFPDDHAIDIALEIALLLNLNIVGEMHVARKQYLDGSIPTGFQRTAILGVGGWIPYHEGTKARRRRAGPEGTKGGENRGQGTEGPPGTQHAALSTHPEGTKEEKEETEGPFPFVASSLRGSVASPVGRRIRITQLSLEEDSCREVSDIGHERVLLTDRLGMPLIETVTEPDMRTPQEAAEVCQIIRLLCRSTGKVRTGYGASREDVNVSVLGGTRVEIKGVPQITRIPRLVYNEARRQCSLLHIRDLLHQRGVRPDTFHWSSQDVTHAVSQSSYEPLRFALSEGARVKCVRLRGFAELLNEPTQEGTHFAQEFTDRIRVIACLTHKPCMTHSDLASETLQGRDWKAVRRRMRAEPGDALILVWGNDEDTNTACNEIAIRAREATVGVPSDTRQALKDGTNGFERVLPGAERMYPDTDLPLLRIDRARLDRIRGGLPERVWEREARYRALGLPADVIVPLCISPRADLFDRLVEGFRVAGLGLRVQTGGTEGPAGEGTEGPPGGGTERPRDPGLWHRPLAGARSSRDQGTEGPRGPGTGGLGIEPTFAAVVLVQRFKHWRRSGLPVERLPDDDIYEVFRAYRDEKVSREAVPRLLRRLIEGFRVQGSGFGVKGPRDQGTQGPRDQGTQGPREGTQGPRDPGIQGPRFVAPATGRCAQFEGPRDQGTQGSRDQGTEGPRDEYGMRNGECGMKMGEHTSVPDSVFRIPNSAFPRDSAFAAPPGRVAILLAEAGHRPLTDDELQAAAVETLGRLDDGRFASTQTPSGRARKMQWAMGEIQRLFPGRVDGRRLAAWLDNHVPAPAALEPGLESSRPGGGLAAPASECRMLNSE